MTILEAAIGWLAPATCIACGVEGAAICDFCKELEILPFGERCFRCYKMSPLSRTCKTCKVSGAPNRVWVVTMYEGPAKDLVQKYKFTHQRVAAADMAQLMSQTFLSQNSNKSIYGKDYLLIPVPTAGARVRERSFDHASLLARKVGQQIGLKSQTLLGRHGSTQQVGASRAQRIKQVKNAIYVKNPQRVSGRNILLIDDVVTTGATLAECARTLRDNGAKSVDAMVFAKRI